MSAVPTSPVSGMRDHLPAAALRRRAAIRRVEAAFLRHGFSPLETPAMERLSTLLGKYGEEGDRLIYRVLHRGGRLERALSRSPVEPGDLAELGLRYDLTVPLARVVAEHRSELPSVFRRYQIQPVWRADRAQRGRFREFTQCDADIVGSRSPVADAEALLALFEALADLGFRRAAVRLNHRELLRGLIAAAGVEPAGETETLVALDKLDKIGREAVEAELARLEPVGPDRARRLLELLPGDEGGRGAREQLRALGRVLGEAAGESARAAVDDLLRLFDLVEGGLDAGPEAGVLRFSPSLARGLSYYTGPIFEAEAAASPGGGSGGGAIAGGGRYDGLVGMFSGREVPAVGFSLGMERILLLLEEDAAAAGRDEAGPPAALCPLPGLPPEEALGVAARLRRAGARIAVSVDSGKVGRQLARAARDGAQFALILGPDEAAAGRLTVRDLRSGEQAALPLAEVPARLAAAGEEPAGRAPKDESPPA